MCPTGVGSPLQKRFRLTNIAPRKFWRSKFRRYTKFEYRDSGMSQTKDTRISHSKWYPKWPKKVYFSKFSNPLFGLNYVPMTIAQVPKVYWIFFGCSSSFLGISHNLTQNGPKRCIFWNFQTHYLGSTMCLWQLPMYQKSTEFFWIQDPSIKSQYKP